MKVGDEYFQAHADAEEGTVHVWHWIITGIRSGTVYAIQKTDYTWVKRSPTNGDYGWAKNISDWNKRRFREADGAPKDWARSKAAAYGSALAPVEAAIKKLTKLRAQLAGQRTKARSRARPAEKSGGTALVPGPKSDSQEGH